MLVIKLTYDGNKFDIPGGPRPATCGRHSAQEYEAVFFSLERPEIYRKAMKNKKKHTICRHISAGKHDNDNMIFLEAVKHLMLRPDELA